MPSPKELMADFKFLVSEIEEKDVKAFGGDVEGHLRVCIAHLRAITVEEKREVVATEEPEPEAEVSVDSETVSIPPKVGPGSTAAVWREYAATAGVEVAEDASRASVIEALETAGVATEAPEAED